MGTCGSSVQTVAVTYTADMVGEGMGVGKKVGVLVSARGVGETIRSGLQLAREKIIRIKKITTAVILFFR